MNKNRLFALIFRLLASLVILYGIIVGSGIVGGPIKILSYTMQSNILCAAFLFYTAIRTLVDLVLSGRRGNVTYHPKLHLAILVTILFTAIVFWCALAPFAGEQNFLSAGNIIQHTLSAVFMLIDKIVFFHSGKIKLKSAFLFALIPVFYVAQSVILGLFGVVFYVKDGVSHHYPYLFMDFESIGYLAIICLVILAVSFILVSALLIVIDTKKHQKDRRITRKS